jgi:hypothetical protein
MSRSLLKEKSSPKIFWTEVVSYTAYLLNRYPMRSLKNKTLYKARALISQVWVIFEFLDALNILKFLEVKRTKLEDKGEKFAFVWYDDRITEYTLYNSITKKMFCN